MAGPALVSVAFCQVSKPGDFPTALVFYSRLGQHWLGLLLCSSHLEFLMQVYCYLYKKQEAEVLVSHLHHSLQQLYTVACLSFHHYLPVKVVCTFCLGCFSIGIIFGRSQQYSRVRSQMTIENSEFKSRAGQKLLGMFPITSFFCPSGIKYVSRSQSASCGVASWRISNSILGDLDINPSCSIHIKWLPVLRQ